MNLAALVLAAGLVAFTAFAVATAWKPKTPEQKRRADEQTRRELSALERWAEKWVSEGRVSRQAFEEFHSAWREELGE